MSAQQAYRLGRTLFVVAFIEMLVLPGVTDLLSVIIYFPTIIASLVFILKGYKSE